VVARGDRASYQSLAGLSATLYSGLDPLSLEGQMHWHYARGSALLELGQREEGAGVLRLGLQLAELLEHTHMSSVFTMSLGEPREAAGEQAYWEAQVDSARTSKHSKLGTHALLELCKLHSERGNYLELEARASQLPLYLPRRLLLLEGAKLLQGLPNELPALEEYPDDAFALMCWGLSDAVAMVKKAAMLDYKGAREDALHLLLRPQPRTAGRTRSAP